MLGTVSLTVVWNTESLRANLFLVLGDLERFLSPLVPLPGLTTKIQSPMLAAGTPSRPSPHTVIFHNSSDGWYDITSDKNQSLWSGGQASIHLDYHSVLHIQKFGVEGLMA